MGIFSNKEKSSTQNNESVIEQEPVTEQSQPNQLEQDRQTIYYSFMYSGINILSDNMVEINPFNTEFYNYFCSAYKTDKISSYMSMTDNQNTSSLMEQTLPHTDHFLISDVNNVQNEWNVTKQVDWILIPDSTNVNLDTLKFLYENSSKGLLIGVQKDSQTSPHKLVEFLENNGMDKFTMQTAFSDNYFAVLIFKQ